MVPPGPQDDVSKIALLRDLRPSAPQIDKSPFAQKLGNVLSVPGLPHFELLLDDQGQCELVGHTAGSSRDRQAIGPRRSRLAVVSRVSASNCSARSCECQRDQ